MLSACAGFAKEYNVTVNALKTVGIHFDKIEICGSIAVLDGVHLERKTIVNHLGNVVKSIL